VVVFVGRLAIPYNHGPHIMQHRPAQISLCCMPFYSIKSQDLAEKAA